MMTALKNGNSCHEKSKNGIQYCNIFDNIDDPLDDYCM